MRIEAQLIELGGSRLLSGQFFVRIALLFDQLPTDFPGGQPRLEPIGPKLGVGLALAIGYRLEVDQQIGQMLFGSFASP